MPFINMLSWWQWTILALVPPAIVMLYFLKLKRTPLEVPSTYLWQKSIEDLHVNSLWQRLRTSILLLLQLLLILLAMFALARPGWSGSKLSGEKFIFLIDTSASMSATDTKPSRLDEAKQRVLQLIEEMPSGSAAMVVSFSDGARIEQEFSDNKRELRRAVEAIQPTNRRTLLGDAIRVAVGSSTASRAGEFSESQVTTEQPATIYILSDGNFPDVQNLPLGKLDPIFVPIGERVAPNVGITAFSTRRRDDRKELLQAFARLENFGDSDVTAEVELYRDDNLIDASKVDLKAHGAGGVAFELGDLHAGALKLRTSQGGSLAIDDSAWAAVDPPARAKVLVVSPANEPLSLALRTGTAGEIADVAFGLPSMLETKEYQQRAAAGYYALVIYDQCAPKEMPACDTLFIGRMPPTSNWSAGEKVDVPQVIDITTSHPLMQLIDLSDVLFLETLIVKPPAGGTVLIESNAGPMFAIAPRDAFEDAVLGAEIIGVDENGERVAKSTWPKRLSFPVFVLNALSYFSGSGTTPTAASVPPGSTIQLRASAATDRLTVRSPSGKETILARDKSETFSFSGTDEVGIYLVEQPGEHPQRFAVNLFDSNESSIAASKEPFRIGHYEVQQQSSWEGARHELWKPLLLVAIGVLGLEWYIYNRRVYL